MLSNNIVIISIFTFILYEHRIQSCEKLPNHLTIYHKNQTNERCLTIGKCYLILNINDNVLIDIKENNANSYYLSYSSKFQLSIDYDSRNEQISFSFNETIDKRIISIKNCFQETSKLIMRDKREQYQTEKTSSIFITFNSSSFIDYLYANQLDYPLSLSVRFRTIGRISNGVILSLINHKSSSSVIPYIIIEHTNGKVELTILQSDAKHALSTVTIVQCGKNVNNDTWHWLKFDIERNGMFTLVVDDDSRASQVPTYVISSWNINGLLVGDTRRLNEDLFRPFIGYMSDLKFNNQDLFTSLTTRKNQMKSSFNYTSRHIVVGYRIAFFNLVTLETQASYFAFSERETQNKNHGKLDVYFLFRSYVPDGIILYRYAQGLNEYFAIGLRAGILTLFIDFGFGKRQIVSDESMKLSDGKWHEVRVTRIGTDKIELIVDNRVNRSTLSANGIRNAVSLQPVLYIGGIPDKNNINLTGSGLDSFGFQGCLSSFIVDGHSLQYQTALVKHGKIKINSCSDLNKLCYDFTCIHSGICTTNENDGFKCECIETGYIGERCDKLPNGYYFGKNNQIGSIEYAINQIQQSEHDTITFGFQTLSMSAQIFYIESDSNLYRLDYEIVRGRSYIKLYVGEKQPDVYSAITHVTDGMYHAIKIVRKFLTIELYVDGIRVKLEGGSKHTRQLDQNVFLGKRRLKIGNFKNTSQWNGIIAGLALNRQSIFDSLANILIKSGDVEQVYPNPYTSQFHLIDTSFISITTELTTTEFTTATTTTTTKTIPMNTTNETTVIPVVDYLHYTEPITQKTIVSPVPIRNRSALIEWFANQTARFSTRTLFLSFIIASCFILLILFIIIRLNCINRNRRRKKFLFKYHQANGKRYSQLNQSRRYSMAPPDGRASKKRVPKLLRYLHTNEAKPTSFRLSNNNADNYHLMPAIQENKPLPYRNSDCVLNEHCCIRSSFSQPTPSSSTLYHELNRLMLSGSEPPLPLSHIAQAHIQATATATLRSLKKDIDNSSVQTYSAVYSCDLASNLDIEQESIQRRSSKKRRSILKNTHSSLIQTKILFLYAKTPVDCYSLQPIHNRTNIEPILLATADENRVQLSHALTGSFHSQLPVSSTGSCHDILFSYNGQYVIGLFYEVTSNVNPYGVKIWSTNDYSLRTNVHPIKCSIASTSRYSSILYMAGKQKYGRGISFGLLDIETCSLARELKSDPDTSIGDEIRRMILTKHETYSIVICAEHSSTYACFVIFKLEVPSIIDDNKQQTSVTPLTMNNCTMLLTRFDSDPNHTFPINESNNNIDQYMLTILRTNQIVIWKLNDGEVFTNYDFQHLNSDNKTQEIVNCQINNNRLLILLEQGVVNIWDIVLPIGQLSLIATISDPLIRSISWIDQRHFLSVDLDGQRIRTWNVNRKDVINELICSSHGTLQSLYVHSLANEHNKRQEYVIIGKSTIERNLLIFEYTPPYDEPSDSSNISVC